MKKLRNRPFIILLFIFIGMVSAFYVCFKCFVADRDNIFYNKQTYLDNANQLYEKSIQVYNGNFHVDSSKYEFLTHIMGGLGIGQSSLNADFHTKQKYLHIIQSCIKKAMSPEATFFDSISWDESPLAAIHNNNHHASYLGYLNLLLSMNRYLELSAGIGPNGEKLLINDEYTQLNHVITKKLMKDFVGSDCGLLQTYPSQAIPTNDAVAIGSIGLYYKAFGLDYTDSLLRIIDRFCKVAIDSETHLLNYYVDYKTGEADGTLRGAGTATGMYFISFASDSVSRILYNSILSNLKDTVYGVHGIRECLRIVSETEIGMDTDTGPVVYGIGTVSTGYTIAGAKMFNDKTTYDDLTRTAWIFGMPRNTSNGILFTNGNAVQNAVMFAILTSRIIPANQNLK
jgi:hypothetical protein